MLKTQPPGPSVFARARIISIACFRDSTPSNRSSLAQVFPARSRCMWLSISPGVTALPPRSIRLRAGPASRPMSALVPTATMRSPRMATAWAIVKRSSTVTIFPFDRIRSGGGCCARDHRARAGEREQRTGDREQSAP